jgi:hypothetical protein
VGDVTSVNGPDGDQEQVRWCEAGVVEAFQVRGHQPLHDLAPAKHRPRQRMITPACLQSSLRDHLGRRVLDQVELGGDNLALNLDLFAEQPRAEHGIEDQVERLVEAFRRDMGGHRANLARCEGVNDAAQRVDKLGDPLRGPITTAPQQQVLKEVRDSSHFGPFVRRAGADPCPDRCGRGAGHFVDEDRRGHCHRCLSVPTRRRTVRAWAWGPRLGSREAGVCLGHRRTSNRSSACDPGTV